MIRFLDSQGFNREIMSLVELMVKVVFICHIFACIWYGIAINNMENLNWIIYY